MADQRILDYVRENISRGVKPDDIRLALLESGWPEAEINEGMAQAGAPAWKARDAAAGGSAEKQKKKGHKKLIVLLIVLVILVFLFLYVASSIVKTFNSMFPGSMDSINGILAGGGS